jgi:hypothetical protein
MSIQEYQSAPSHVSRLDRSQLRSPFEKSVQGGGAISLVELLLKSMREFGVREWGSFLLNSTDGEQPHWIGKGLLAVRPEI